MNEPPERRVRTKLLLGNVLLLAGILGIALFASNYYYQFFRGPFPLDDGQLLRYAERPGGGSLLVYAQLSDRRLIDTGWREVSTQDDKEYASYPYFLMPVADRFMLVQAQSAADGKHLVGPISQGRSEFEEQVISNLEQEQPELRGKILPIRMSAVAAFTVIGYLGLAVLVPLTLLAIVNIVRAVLGSPAQAAPLQAEGLSQGRP